MQEWMLQLEFEFFSRQTTKLNRSWNVNVITTWKDMTFSTKVLSEWFSPKNSIIRVFSNTIWNIAKDTIPAWCIPMPMYIWYRGKNIKRLPCGRVTLKFSSTVDLIMRSSSCWSIPSHWLGSVSFCNIDTKANAVTLVWRREATNTKTGFCGENCRIAFKVN